MAINSKDKGKRGERMCATKLREYGYDARRGVQRRSDGTFLPNQNRWLVKNNLLYCYLEDELLFFTEKKNWYLFKGLSVTKSADGYSAVRKGTERIFTHRLICHAKEGDIVDHINRNKKDNRLTNLRITNKSVNAFNSKLRTDNTSGVRGVWYRKDTDKWTAEIMKDGKKYALGCFETKDEAIRARKEAEVKHYGY